MSGDNSSGTGSTNPVVRLRGLPKKTADAPPAAPVTPPKAPIGPPEVRVRRRVPTQPAVEEVAPLVEATTEVEEPVLAAALVSTEDPVAYPAEYPAATEQSYQEYPVEEPAATYVSYEAAPVEQGYETYQEPVEAAPAGQPEQYYQEPLAEAPVEQYAAAPVEPYAVAPAPVESPAASAPASKTPDAPAAPGLTGGVRLRIPPKGASTSHAPPPRSEAWKAGQQEESVPQAARSGTRRESLPAAPAGPLYTPDTDLDRIYRRQWWKHDLKVKAGRWQGEEAKK